MDHIDHWRSNYDPVSKISAQEYAERYNARMAGMNEWLEEYTAPLRSERDALRVQVAKLMQALEKALGFVGCWECPTKHDDCMTKGEGRCKEYLTAWAISDKAQP